MKLERAKGVLVVKMLSDGASIRSIERVANVNRDTVLRVLNRVGDHCQSVMDSHFQGLIFNAIECDEAWTFCGKKAKNCAPWESDLGDYYVYVGQDPETKLVPCFTLGKRDEGTTHEFVSDLASRVNRDLQVSTDGFQSYRPAIAKSFGPNADYMMIIKKFNEKQNDETRRYSPPSCVGVDRVWVSGRSRICLRLCGCTSRCSISAGSIGRWALARL